MTGIKSGSTSLAGYCYVGSASLNGVDLISVVMYSSQYGVWTDTKKLMAYGFSQYQHVTISELYNLNPISIYTSAYEIDDPNQGQLTLLCQPQDAHARPPLRNSVRRRSTSTTCPKTCATSLPSPTRAILPHPSARARLWAQ